MYLSVNQIKELDQYNSDEKKSIINKIYADKKLAKWLGGFIALGTTFFGLSFQRLFLYQFDGVSLYLFLASFIIYIPFVLVFAAIFHVVVLNTIVIKNVRINYDEHQTNN